LKVWTVILSDPDFDELHNQTIGIWVRLAALAALHGENGNVTIKSGQFKKRTHLQEVTESDLKRICDELKTINVNVEFDERYNCNVTFKNWSKYQAYSESYERVKKHRDKKKSVTNVTPTRAREEKRREENRIRKEKSIYTQDFLNFYSLYPRKVAKADAQKAWNTLKPDDELRADIVIKLEKQKDSTDWKKENGKYIPYPATWIRERRWEDELKEAQTDSPVQNHGPNMFGKKDEL